MTNITVSVPAIEKLLDHLASGVGAVGGSWIASWRAKKQSEAALIAAKGEAERQRILTGTRTESFRAYALAQTQARALLESSGSAIQGEIEVSDLVTARIRFQEEKRQRNIKAVVEQAASELGEKQVEDREPDHDWTARFFSEVQDVSSEEMQLLWSRVLAGEVERPGRSSVRTLGILRNLDRETAKLFSKLCSLCISIRLDDDHFLDARVPSLGKNAAQNGLKDYGLGYAMLNILNEHGLIISDYNSWQDYRVCIGIQIVGFAIPIVQVPFQFQGSRWFLVPIGARCSSPQFRVSGVALSHAGLELSRVVLPDSDKKYARELAAFFESQELKMTLAE